jgi:hypothetical protein
MPSTNYIQNFMTSRDNNAYGPTFVGQEGRLWYNPVTNAIYVSDGVTPGGILVSGGGNVSPPEIIDGGFAASVYTIPQIIGGGGA